MLNFNILHFGIFSEAKILLTRMNDFRVAQSTTTGGKAFHAIIVRGINENLNVSL